jgi:hypothetical protein
VTGRVARLSGVRLRVSTPIESSLSWLQDLRLRLSEPIIAHTSSTTTTLAGTYTDVP